MRKCTVADFPGFEADFDKNNLDGALCFDQEDIPVSGIFLSNIFQFLQFTIEKCNNATHSGYAGITCAS